MEADPKWVAYLNLALGFAVKFGLLGYVTVALWKFLDWMDGKIQHGLEEGKAKANEFRFLQHMKVDDLLFDTLKGLSFTTFKTIKGVLQAQLDEGKISPTEFRNKLHADVKENFKKAVSKAKQEVFATAYEDIDAVIDVMLPGVIKEAKAEARIEEAAKGAATAPAATGAVPGNS